MTSKKQDTAIRKYLKGELDRRELDIIVKGLSDEQIKEQFKRSVEIDYLLSTKYLNIDSETAYLDFLSKRKQQRLQKKGNNKIEKRRFPPLLKYAAVFFGLVGMGYFFSQKEFQSSSPSLLQVEDESITLQLGNGKVEVINLDADNQVLNENGHKVATQKEDRITYSGNSDLEELVYNELNIPYGKKFKIELSDGTVVHMNSGSSLKYPVKFLKGKERKVFVKGEAYFDVAEDSEHPFIVHARQVNIRVLGTKFNVSSYEEDDDINTVLVSGKVQLYKASNSYNAETSLKILPEQMGVWSKDHKKFNTYQVDTSIYTSWMTGRLVFRNLPFKVIRKKLERHYNVAIMNSDKVLDENTFNAVFDIENINEVMETFDRNFGIKYKILNNQIIIQPKKE